MQITACIYDYVFILKHLSFFSDIGTEAVQTGAAAPPDPARPIPAAPKHPTAPAAKQQMAPPWENTGPKKDVPAHDAKQPPTKAMPKYAAPQNKQIPVKTPPYMKGPKQPSGPPPGSAKTAVILQIFTCSAGYHSLFKHVCCFAFVAYVFDFVIEDTIVIDAEPMPPLAPAWWNDCKAQLTQEKAELEKHNKDLEAQVCQQYLSE